jgi:beta-glucanase (GH16 family)
LKSEGKYKFNGKVEVRAKLTTGAGTWPAIWMLGSDYATNTWPGCGEIDIMEYKEVNLINMEHSIIQLFRQELEIPIYDYRERRF